MSNTYIRLPTSSGGGGGSSDSFTTIQTPFGTAPVATSSTDTLTFTGTNVTITGNSITDTINFAVHDEITLGTANGLSLVGQILSLTTATSSTTGALTSTDWSTFNSKQAGDATLTALAAYNTNGLLTQIAPDTFTGRTIIAGTGISVTDGNGVSGNPTIASTITQYTDEMAQDAVGGILTDSATIDFTYNDVGNTITAIVIDGSITNVKVASGIDAIKIADGSVSNTEFQYLDGVTSSIQTQLNNKQPLDSTLTSLAAYNTNGLLTQTAADTFTGRTITAGTGISISNGDGVLGNPTITSTITQYTDEMAQDAVGSILVDSSTIDFTYDDAGNTITAIVIDGSITNAKIATGIDAVKIANGSVSNTEFQFLDGVTSSIQTQINGKQDTITGAATTVTTVDLTASRALISNGSGKIAVSAVTSTELGYVSGVTSALQTQIDNKQPLDATLTSLAAYNTNGILTQTTADTFTGRTITGTASNISISNGNGVAGNPTIDLIDAGTAGTYGSASQIPVFTTDVKGRVTAVTNTSVQITESQVTNLTTDLSNKQPLDATLTSLAAYNTNGILTQTAADTFTGRTITGTASNISITNGSGVAGNPTIDLVNAGTAGTYKTPSSVTTDAKGRVTSITAGSDFPIDPTIQSVLFDDFISNLTTSAIDWDIVNTGTNTAPSMSGAGSEAFNRAQGAIQLSTGTTGAGRSAIWLGADMGIGYTTIAQQWRMALSALSDGTQTYQYIIGFGDTAPGNNITQTNAIAFVYDQSVSANWLCRTIAAGVTTSTTTTTAIDTAWNTFRIAINAAGTSVVFSINGTTVATHTTNIPGFLQFVGPIAKINKTVGTTARTATIDYFWQRLDWSSAR